MLFKIKLLLIEHVYTEKYLFKKEFRLLKKRILKYIKTHPNMVSFPIEVEDLKYVYSCSYALKQHMDKIRLLNYSVEYDPYNNKHYIQINDINGK